MGQAIGADVVDMKWVQVHPTGLIDPRDPTNKVKTLAAEALRGCGAIMIDATGNRFVDELGRRDYVSSKMKGGKGPFRLLLNSRASNEILGHCKHYAGRGLMRKVESGAALAKEMGISPSVLKNTFDEYTAACQKGTPDKFGKKFFRNFPYEVEDYFYVAQITPVVHYTMGGIAVNDKAEVLNANQ